MPGVGILSSQVAAAPTTGFKASLGNAASTASGTTVVITTTAAIAIGDLVVVRWAADNLSATTPTGAVTDSGGNTYTAHAFRGNNATAASGIVGGIAATLAAAAVAAGGTITLTLSGAVTQKAIYAESFAGYINTLRNAAVVASGASTSPSVTSGSATSGDLVIGAVAVESRTAPSAYDTDTTNGSWSTGFVKPSNTTGTDTGLVEIAGQYKVVTATAAQTYNLTTANTDWAAMVAIFQPYVPPTAPAAPTLNTPTPGNGQVSLTWTAPSDGGAAITDYLVEYRTTAGPGSWTTFAHAPSTLTSNTVTGLTNGTGYDFRVSAINSVGTGTASNVQSATPTSTWTPALLATLSLWLDADDATKFTFGTGAAVASWTDKSPNAYVLTQATAGSQPLRNGTLNGKTSVVFDGTDDFVQNLAAPVNNATNGAYTAFAVFRATGFGNERSIVDADHNIAGERVCQILRADGTQLQTITFDAGGSNSSMQGGSLSTGVTYIGRSWVDGPNGKLSLNGTEVGTLTQASQRYMSTATLTIGAQDGGTRQYWSGHIAEVIVCSSALSGTDITNVENYLTAKWGV